MSFWHGVIVLVTDVFFLFPIVTAVGNIRVVTFDTEPHGRCADDFKLFTSCGIFALDVDLDGRDANDVILLVLCFWT